MERPTDRDTLHDVTHGKRRVYERHARHHKVVPADLVRLQLLAFDAGDSNAGDDRGGWLHAGQCKRFGLLRGFRRRALT